MKLQSGAKIATNAGV